jgi:steroid 5-alpha reductase family enzyme
VANVRERIGCFFLAVGIVLLFLYALPIVQAFKRNPATVPVEWLGIAGISLFLLWAGGRLYLSARRNAASQRPPSLAARLMARGKSDDEKDE